MSGLVLNALTVCRDPNTLWDEYKKAGHLKAGGQRFGQWVWNTYGKRGKSFSYLFYANFATSMSILWIIYAYGQDNGWELS